MLRLQSQLDREKRPDASSVPSVSNIHTRRYSARIRLFYMTYQEKLQDPRWLKKRTLLISARGGGCELCGNSQKLTIHHGYYRFKTDPWDYDDDTLWVLCWPCHETTQQKLTAIHEIIARINPREMDNLRTRIDDGTFDLVFGATRQEVEEILAEERDAESKLYSKYDIAIISSSALGFTQAYEMEKSAEETFPGIHIEIISSEGERDSIATVKGPDEEVRLQIQNWCDGWNS